MTSIQQVALVTGATSGIGKATATALADAGFQVIGTGRNTARATPPAGVTYLDLDVTSDESVASAVKQVIDRFGRIDVLVNNAGVGSTGAAEEFSIAQTQDIFDINVYGVMRMTKAVLPHMRAQRRGRVINVSSLSGFVPSPFMTLYVATKHAVEGYSQSLDHEVREHGVRILLVEPGPINTPFAGHSVEADTPMPLYAAGRRNYDELMAKNLSGGDDPAVVAKVIVAAATDRNPKLRLTAGTTARTINAVYRVAPARIFDRVIRRYNRMPNWRVMIRPNGTYVAVLAEAVSGSWVPAEMEERVVRYAKEHKQETRQRIIATVGRRLKRDGIDGSGVATLMKDAGLTNGAFYAHFSSKDRLVATAIANELDALHANIVEQADPGAAGLEQIVRRYLSADHRDDPGDGCPNAALLDEIARGDYAVRQAYTDGVLVVIDGLAARMAPEDPLSARVKALSLLGLMAGTLQLSRALTDRQLSDDLLGQGLRNALALVDAELRPVTDTSTDEPAHPATSPSRQEHDD